MGSTGVGRNDRDRLSDLEGRLAKLERSAGLAASSLSDGSVLIRGAGAIAVSGGGSISIDDGGYVQILPDGRLVQFGPGGETVLFVGTLPNYPVAGINQPAVGLLRSDGSKALEFSDVGPDDGVLTQQVRVLDRPQNTVIAESRGAAGGLARPYLNYSTLRNALNLTTITAATFTMVELGAVYRQHPYYHGWFLIYADAGTTGEWQLTVGGDVAIPPQPIADGVYTTAVVGPAPWEDSWDYYTRGPSGGWQNLDLAQLEVRRTSGAGNVSASCIGLWGVESA